MAFRVQYFHISLRGIIYQPKGKSMNTILKLIAVTITGSLLFVAVTNITAAPVWMSLMILVSSTVIFFVGLDLAESLKKVKVFTMIELIAVITVMAILLTMVISVMKTDPSSLEIKKVGSMIKLYQSKAFSLKGESLYIISLKSGEFKITDQDGIQLELIELKSDISFRDGSAVKSFNLLNTGECQVITGNDTAALIFKVGNQEGKVNIFTGKFSYYLDPEEQF